MSEKVYLAKSMPADPSEPVYAERIGETPDAAKNAIMEVTSDVCPSVIHRLQWNDPYTVQSGWKFICKEYNLQTNE